MHCSTRETSAVALPLRTVSSSWRYARFVERSDLIRVSGSDVGDRELASIAHVFSRGYLGMGSDVAAFERALESRLQRPVACVATGTAALQLALQAVGVGPGDEVMVPTLTYVAACQAVSATGADPVLVDVLPGTLTMDPASAARRLTKRTRALLPTYYGGGICQLADIYELANKMDLRVVEDAAHAFGSINSSTQVGSSGDVTCFSFDPIKNLTSGEGGCVVSSDEEVMSRVRDLRLLGVRGDSQARTQETRLYEFDVVEQGWRFHMSNICAAIGLAQLETFPTRALKRQKLAKQYELTFQHLDQVETLPWDYDLVVPHIYVILLASSRIRDALRDHLRSRGVETALHWFPNHRLTRFYADASLFPVAEDAFSRMLTLPLHPRLTVETVRLIATDVQAFVQAHS